MNREDSTSVSSFGFLPSKGAICIRLWLSQKVSEGLWSYVLACALTCSFRTLGMASMLVMVTAKEMLSPDTGIFSRARDTDKPWVEPKQHTEPGIDNSVSQRRLSFHCHALLAHSRLSIQSTEVGLV